MSKTKEEKTLQTIFADLFLSAFQRMYSNIIITGKRALPFGPLKRNS